MVIVLFALSHRSSPATAVFCFGCTAIHSRYFCVPACYNHVLAMAHILTGKLGKVKPWLANRALVFEGFGTSLAVLPTNRWLRGSSFHRELTRRGPYADGKAIDFVGLESGGNESRTKTYTSEKVLSRYMSQLPLCILPCIMETNAMFKMLPSFSTAQKKRIHLNIVDSQGN